MASFRLTFSIHLWTPIRPSRRLRATSYPSTLRSCGKSWSHRKPLKEWHISRGNQVCYDDKMMAIKILNVVLVRYGGVVLTHNEVGKRWLWCGVLSFLNDRRFTAADCGEGAILPTWTAVDNGSVKTSSELWGFMKKEGWNVDVRSIVICLHNRLNFSPSITGKIVKCFSLFRKMIPDISIPISPDRPIEVSFF